MRNRFLVGAGVALAVTLGGAAGAQAQFLALPSGGAFYIGGEGGWTWLNDQTLHPSGTFSNALGGRSKKENFSGGPAIGVRAGYEWGPWRLEEEFAYRINGIDFYWRYRRRRQPDQLLLHDELDSWHQSMV